MLSGESEYSPLPVLLHKYKQPADNFISFEGCRCAVFISAPESNERSRFGRGIPRGTNVPFRAFNCRNTGFIVTVLLFGDHLGVYAMFMCVVFEPAKLHGRRCYQDRKSTRLNSSHVAISYAVFCLKK